MAFSDESQYNTGRFGCIALVSIETDKAKSISQELKKASDESEASEVRWQKVRNAKYRFAAQKFIDITIDAASAGYLRVDTLVWDKEDERHQIQRRDDLANLQIMYYHLIRNVLRRRWQIEGTWILCPDEQSSLDWKALEGYLTYKRWTNPQFAWSEPGMTRLREEYRVLSIQEVTSESQPLVQVADLFAGMGTYSFECYPTLKQWQVRDTGQLNLFPKDSPRFSGSEEEHSKVICHFLQTNKARGMGVSLSQTKQGLYTPDPSGPINYWPYAPQHHMDKAPVKGKK